MLNTPCPYCKYPEMPEPPKTVRPYGKCPACGKKSRAKLTPVSGGAIISVTYSATAHYAPAGTVKRVRTIRLSDAEMEAIELGKIRLTVTNNRITIAV